MLRFGYDICQIKASLISEERSKTFLSNSQKKGCNEAKVSDLLSTIHIHGEVENLPFGYSITWA